MFRFLYSLYGMILFCVLLLLLLPVFFIVSLFGKIKGGNMLYRICSFWADCWLLLLGIRVKVSHLAGSTEHRPCIFVANHISYMDIPMIVKVIREPVRILGKSEFATVPVFGFVYRNAVVMVNRKDAEQRARSVKTLKAVLSKGISIFIFPEGTFNTTDRPLKDFYDGAFRIALETGTPIQPLLFPDTIKRMHYKTVFSLTPGTSRAVYLPLVPVTGYNEKDSARLKADVYALMEKKLVELQHG
ncbi:MAG: lysophospholipid acyltransferase family protein [Flavihumibacter sp.]